MLKLKKECPECGNKSALMLESFKGFGNLEDLIEGYNFYRCIDCGYSFKIIDGEIKEVSEEEAQKITERALKYDRYGGVH